MPLYVARAPNPLVSLDWYVTVPGQYLFDVTGITATLTTTAGGATVMADASGNNRDGNYRGGNNAGWFQPGIVAGDTSFLTGTLFQGSKFFFDTPYAAVQWASPWSFACWVEVPVIPGSMAPILMNALVSPNNPGAQVRLDPGPNGAVTVFGQLDGWTSATGVVPTDGSACFIAVVWDGATMTLYIDGAGVAWASEAHFPGVNPVNLAPFACSANGTVSNTQIYVDEWAVWETALSAGDVASMFAAASTSFPAYNAAVVATAPAMYYHLDDGSISAGRQVTLEITDGSDTVELVPSGFPLAPPGGPFAYSWQPKLGASAQTTDGTTTTVAIPRLTLPAGYTIGTRTLDLGGGDQWSDIAIWWDSALMDAIDPARQFEYPPGFKLLYQQDVTIPVGGNRVIF